MDDRRETNHFPRIGVTVPVDMGGSGDLYPGHPLVYLERTYLDTLQAHDMMPIILPPTAEKEWLVRYADQIDGLLLTGGGYLPLHEDPAKLPGLDGTGQERFRFEMALLDVVVPTGMPVMGICRGCQMINAFFGGSLVNLPAHGVVEHHQEKRKIPGHVPVHGLTVAPESRMADWLGSSEIRVNSFHRQAIERPGRGLTITARCTEDRVVEVVEAPDHPWLVGFQFHPEKMWRADPVWSNVFRSFREAACAYRRAR